MSTFLSRLARWGLAVLVALTSFVLVSGPSAQAAQFTHSNAISNISLSSKYRGADDQAQKNDVVRVDAEWAVPNSAKAGDTFGMVMPKEIGPHAGGKFEVKDEATGEKIADCKVSSDAAPVLTCTLTNYVDGKDNLKGKLWYEVVLDQTTQANELMFDVGSEVSVKIPGKGGIVMPVDRATDKTKKYPWRTGQPDLIGWTIEIPATIATNGTIEITDELTTTGDYESHTISGNSLRLVEYRLVNGDGTLDAAGWKPVPTTDYVAKLDADKKGYSLSLNNIPTNEKRQYRVIYHTKIDGAYFKGDKYHNTATVQQTKVESTYKWEPLGGGDGAGEMFTRFSIVKSITGDAAGKVPADTEFTIKYDAAGESNTLTLKPGDENRVNSLRYPIGTTFTISEINFPNVEGVNWGDYTMAGEGVTDNGDGTYSVTPPTNKPVALTLTNEATPSTGNVKVTKKVTGDDAALVPVDTEFTIGYSYQIEGQDPVSGELKLKDGESAELPEALPVGTEVTLSEASPERIVLNPVKALVFGVPAITVGDELGQTVTFTVTEPGQVVDVTVDNPVTLIETVGNLNITKQVTGDGAELVPADTEFTVAYSYQVEGQDDVVSGTVKVKNGESVQLPYDVPTDTEVTLTEVKHDDIVVDDNTTVVFGTPVITAGDQSGESVTVKITEMGHVIDVTVENPTTVTEVPPTSTPVPPTSTPVPTTSATPSPAPTNDTPTLAATGADGIAWMGGVALLLIAAGTAAVLVKRRTDHKA